MRAVVQRVNFSDVTVDGVITGSIDRGLTVLLGVGCDDTETDLNYIVNKVCGLRIFEDTDGKMNLSVKDVGGSILAISQFTLYGDARHGKRPGFSDAADPKKAEALYEQFIDGCRQNGLTVEKGIFQTHMLVRINNEGPVTILLDSKKLF